MQAMRLLNDRQPLHTLARVIDGSGWLLAFLLLVIGSVLAATRDNSLGLLMRASIAGAILVVTSAISWLIKRYADRDSYR
jgi:drug/metabolite transporter (DMT)-like permease